MKFSKIYTAQSHLLKAHLISVETDITRGLHSFSIVGLPDKAIEEARDRVSAAIKNSGFKSPKQTNAKITVSLAPSEMRKEGAVFDLPIALGYLLAAEEIDFDPENKLFIGELALDGTLRPVNGVLSYARKAKESHFKDIFVPVGNADEASLIEGIRVFGANDLTEVIDHVTEKKKIDVSKRYDIKKLIDTETCGNILDDVAGQETAKRGLIIAAAGRHNIGLFGPPGTGKTMLARALLSIMPPLTFEEMIEVTEIHSIAGATDGEIITRPPVRAPHHTASYTALVGGGSIPRPGEITLAHRGVLFMDEFPEFDKRVIEALRQPLEDRVISISRAKGNAVFPADFVLIAALNPCPCGNKGIAGKECSCSPAMIRNYEKKISGPIVDRIDMWIEMSKVDHEKLIAEKIVSEQTDRALDAVIKARAIQKRRFARLGINTLYNSNISPRDLSRAALLSEEAVIVLNKAAKTFDVSGRGYHRIVRLARTIADLAESEKIEAPHILEALQYRERHFKKD